MEYYSTRKKNEVMPSAAIWMDLEIVTLSEENQTEKDKCHMILLRFRIFKKDTNEPIYKTDSLT